MRFKGIGDAVDGILESGQRIDQACGQWSQAAAGAQVIPIVYPGVMGVGCLIAGCCWNQAARLIMLVLFLAAFVVGGLGFWFHNHGNFGKVADDSVGTWTNPKMKHPHWPPETAPMVFAGLGLLGVLACAKRFN